MAAAAVLMLGARLSRRPDLAATPVGADAGRPRTVVSPSETVDRWQLPSD